MTEDRRVRKSKNAIKKAMIYLMHRKTVSQITITELCQLADINRSTFYSNYENINDCLSDLHKDFFDAIQLFDNEDSTGFRLDVISKMMKYVTENKDVVKILFTNNENNLLEKNLESYFRKQYHINKRNIQEYYFFLYRVLGSFSLLKQWIKDDFPCSAEEIAEIITKLTKKEV